MSPEVQWVKEEVAVMSLMCKMEPHKSHKYHEFHLVKVLWYRLASLKDVTMMTACHTSDPQVGDFQADF